MMRSKRLTIAFNTTLFLTGVANVTDVAGAPSAPLCRDVSNPPVGTRCYERVEVSAPKVKYPEHSKSPPRKMTVPHGWAFTGTEGPVTKSCNHGSIDLNFTQGGSVIAFQDGYNDFSKYLNETRMKYDGGEIEFKGIKIKPKTDVLNKIQEDSQNYHNAFLGVKTNVDFYTVTATAQGFCNTKLMGNCVDNHGGWCSGYYDIYMTYVGTPEFYQTKKQEIDDKVKQMLDEAEKEARAEIARKQAEETARVQKEQQEAKAREEEIARKQAEEAKARLEQASPELEQASPEQVVRNYFALLDKGEIEAAMGQRGFSSNEQRDEVRNSLEKIEWVKTSQIELVKADSDVTIVLVDLFSKVKESQSPGQSKLAIKLEKISGEWKITKMKKAN